ncbi:MAG: rod shape-determining protein, partial [Minisyncoccota bacterium]
MVLDIGGGTSDIAVVSLGGIVKSKNLRIAGDRFNQDIISYIRNQFKILIGEKTAESVKFIATSLIPMDSTLEARVKGRDLVTGLPREVIITDADLREALSASIEALVFAVREVLEITPPEVLADVIDRGIFLAGGGALLRGLPELLESELHIPIHVASDPLSAVARGTGVILEDVERFRSILMENEDELPQKV